MGDGQGLSTVTRRAVGVSPDGSTIVLATPYHLLRRSLASQSVEPIPGSESRQVGVSNPTFSPDGKSLAFWSAGSIKTIPVSGGTPTIIAPAINPFGMDWVEAGIFFASDNDIFRVSPDGGTPELVVDLPSGHSPLTPQVLPDGTHILFTMAQGSSADRWERAQIVVENIRTKERTTVVDGGADGRYVTSGHIVYALGGVLYAAPFDVNSRKVTGAPLPVVEGVRRGLTGAMGTAHYAVSPSGLLAYVPGPTSSASATMDLTITSRDGGSEPLGLPSGPYQYPRISPNGRQVAVASDNGREANIWIYDLNKSSAIRRLTLGGSDRFPAWSADGQWVAFQSMRDGDAGIFRQRADGSGAVERLTRADSGSTHMPESWSPTENALLFSITKNDTTTLWLHSVASGTRERFGDVTSVGNQVGATFSPDGKWVAYSTGDRGPTNENFVFVQPFPATGAKYQISQAGENGHHPQWSRDQKELYYVPLVGQFVVRSITTGPSFSFGNPQPVPRQFPVAAPVTPRTYDVTRDGRVISVFVREADGEGRRGLPGSSASVLTLEVTVVTNWFEELKARVRPR
jgi:serine/threonine-protein kinase